MQCNAVVNDGPKVIPEFVAAAPPAAMGGAVGDGKWMLTAYTVFTGLGGQPIPLGELNWVSSVWMISGAKIEEVTGSRSEDQPDSPRTSTYTVSVSGTSLSLDETCPCPAVREVPFTATESELTLYEPAKGATVALTLTKQ